MTHTQLIARLAEIEAALKARRISVASFLRSANVHQATWGRWKRQETCPNMWTWMQIENAFDALKTISAKDA